jgi:hypothetical protein
MEEHMSLLPLAKTQPPALSGEPSPLVQLLPEINLADYYAKQTGFKPDPSHFGVYAVQAVGNTLYLGLASARPAEVDGALLAKTDGTSLSPVYQPPEKGFIGMHYCGDMLLFPGAYPMEDWTRGNIYTGKPPDKIVKRRTLPNVVHTWGLCSDPSADRVYAAVGRHAGDNQTFFGGVMISEDQGETWRVASDPKCVLGDYRTYDIAMLGDTLYATSNDEYGKDSRLAASTDGGATWKRVNVKVEGRPRLLAARDCLVAQQRGGDGLILISPKGKATRTRFRDFAAAEWSYNYICAGYGGWYYLLADGGRIYNSRDLKDWTLVAATGLSLLAVGYWQTKNWLIVTDRGSNAGLWRLDLALYGAV